MHRLKVTAQFRPFTYKGEKLTAKGALQAGSAHGICADLAEHHASSVMSVNKLHEAIHEDQFISKLNILSLFTHTRVVLNLYAVIIFFFSWNTKR